MLSSIIGLLISIPLSGEMNSRYRGAFLLASALGGAIIGRRRKDSVGFFYFCLIAVVALAWLVSFRYFVMDSPAND